MCICSFILFWWLQVEKIENPALKKLFELNAKRVGSKAQTLYQRVNAQFCNLICRVGFQREYAPPKGRNHSPNHLTAH